MRSYKGRITIEAGKRGGKPCIRGLRITVYDILECLANGMNEKEIIEDFPEIEHQDIQACLAFAADRERSIIELNSFSPNGNFHGPASSGKHPPISMS